MYEGDAPLAERRAAALALDRDLLRELLGAEELRELLDPDVLADLELELQRLVEGRQARDADELHDLLRLLGPLTLDELGLRSVRRRAGQGLGRPAGRRSAGPSSAASRARSGSAPPRTPAACATRSASPCRSACPRACTESVRRPLLDLVARYARTHGPFLTQHAAGRYGVGVGAGARRRSRRSSGEGRVVRGEFRPDGVEREWCDDEVLRQLRRRSLAALRREVEPVDAATLARFLPALARHRGQPARASTRWSR